MKDAVLLSRELPIYLASSSEIKRLALVVGKSKDDIDDHIKPLTDKLQGAVQDELQSLPEAKDHFDQFYKYVGSL